MPIRWKRSNDGFVGSHCCEWRIVPLYCGCTRPQDFELWRLGKVVATMCGTQRGAKDSAEGLARRFEASRRGAR